MFPNFILRNRTLWFLLVAFSAGALEALQEGYEAGLLWGSRPEDAYPPKPPVWMGWVWTVGFNSGAKWALWEARIEYVKQRRAA